LDSTKKLPESVVVFIIVDFVFDDFSRFVANCVLPEPIIDVISELRVHLDVVSIVDKISVLGIENSAQSGDQQEIERFRILDIHVRDIRVIPKH
jgi:hypothetical protein